MADDGEGHEEPLVNVHIKSSNDAKYTLNLPVSVTVADLKSKLATSEYADIPVERQRLIYSGRVLKDADTLAKHEFKDGNTIHLVKGAASNQRQNPANQASSSAAAGGASATNQGVPGVPTNLAAGTGNNPLAGLTGARYAGFTGLPGAGMFGPDGGMGPPPDPESMINMLQNPQFATMMNEALQNPTVLDMMIQQNPMLRNMGPMARQIVSSPEFRQMLTNPAMIRQAMQMQRAMGGMGPFGGAGGGEGGSFPAPGVTNTTAAENRNGGGTSATPGQANTTGTPQPPANPFSMLGGMFGAPPAQPQTGSPNTQTPPNPFAAMFANTGNRPPGSPLPNPWFVPPGHTPATSPPPPVSAGQGTPQRSGTPSQQEGSNTSTQQPEGLDQTQQAQQQAQQQAFANLANLFGAAGQNPSPGGLPSNNYLQAMMNAMGGVPGQGQGQGQGAQGNDPLAGLRDYGTLFGGMGSPPPPPDNRPPEERYAEQLRQLNDMGFYEFERNVEALRRSGGSVEGAVDYLLTHP
ncbi:MAG: hypothetical protein M1834_002357 [Cirrosporium novae-zelandiae]|nr:MAG: hypothetical protein M1834_002357 [Cirrosporium novae-zelandiae]